MEISSKEDFKVAFDKIPDYKIRKEKVSLVVVKSHIVTTTTLLLVLGFF